MAGVEEKNRKRGDRSNRQFACPSRSGDLHRRVSIALAPTSYPLTIVPHQCYNSPRHTPQGSSTLQHHARYATMIGERHMDFAWSAEEETFRGEIREFLQAELPEGWGIAQFWDPDDDAQFAFAHAFT